ncbi:phage major capsid protein [Desulfobacula sp.]|uniref:phage major capsid protein n=1 Tax=Desulfobacula sp. TaxID=2593537 RepID=UPI0039B8D4F6
MANVIRKKNQYKKPVSQGGTESGWVGEIDSRPETDTPTVSIWQPAWREIYANPGCIQAIIDDPDFDIQSWLLEEIGDSFTQKEGAGFISGNQVSQVSGLLSYPTVANESWTWGNLGYISGGHTTLLNNADKLVFLQHSVAPGYRANSCWLMNDSTLETVRKLKDGDGNYLWRPGLEVGSSSILLGKPVLVHRITTAVGASCPCS